MSLTVEVLNGGGTAAGTAVLTSRLRADLGLSLGNRAYDGQGAQGSLVFDDDDGEYGDATDLPGGLTMLSVAAHNRIWVIETATTPDTYLLNGRVGEKAIGRGDIWQDRSRQVKLTLEDANSHLRGITLTSDQARGSESDVTRVTWVLTTFLQGSPRLTTNLTSRIINSDTVTMPAKTYEAGTPIIDIIRDCATAAGKVFFVYNEGDGTLSLYYAVNSDTSLLAGMRISDDPDLINTEGAGSISGEPVVEAVGSNKGDSVDTELFFTVTEDMADTAFYLFAHVSDVAFSDDPTWLPEGVTGPNTQDFTLIHSEDRTASGSMAANKFQIWRLLNPTPSDLDAVIGSHIAYSAGHHILGAFLLSGVDQADPNESPVGNTGSGTESSITLTHASTQLALNAAGWRVDNQNPTAGPADGGGQTEGWSDFQDSSFGNSDLEQGGGYGASAPTWTFNSSQPWTAVGVVVNGSGASLPTFPPIWVNNTASVENGLGLLSGGVLRHGGGAVSSNSQTIVDQYDYHVEPINDVQAVDAADGTARLAKILSIRNTEDRTYTVAVQLHQTQVDLPHAGDLIDINAHAIPDADDQFVTRRIASLEWQWVGPEHYLAVMELDRPLVGVGNPGSSGAAKAEVSAQQKADAAVTAHEGAADPHSGYVRESEFAAKGDILAGTGSGALDNLTVGTNDHVLTADSSTATGLKWAAAPGGGSGLIIEEGDGSPSGTATKLILPNGTLGFSGGTATYTPVSTSGIIVQEDGVAEGTATVLNYTTNMDVSYSGGTATISSTGGSGISWNADIDESGAAFTNWTANSGTWASDGTAISQSAAITATHHRARYNTMMPIGMQFVFEADIRVDATANNESAGGLNIGYNGTNGTGSLAVGLEPGADTVQIESQGVGIIRTISATINEDTWYTLRVECNGVWTSVYFDGTLIGSTRYSTITSTTADYVGLVTYNAQASFRNIKFWSLEQPV